MKKGDFVALKASPSKVGMVIHVEPSACRIVLGRITIFPDWLTVRMDLGCVECGPETKFRSINRGEYEHRKKKGSQNGA
jgi:hypothetical protein